MCYHKITVIHTILYSPEYAGVAELADAQDLGSCAIWRAGSTPVTRTKSRKAVILVFLDFFL